MGCHSLLRGIFPIQGPNPCILCLLHCQVGSLSLAPTGKPYLPHAAATAAKSFQSCPTLCDPIDGSPPGSPVPGILQARTLEWVAISFSNAWKWKVKGKSLSSCLTPSDPRDCSPPGSSVHGIFLQEYWSGVPLPSPIYPIEIVKSYKSELFFFPRNPVVKHLPAHYCFNWRLSQRISELRSRIKEAN